MAITPTVASVDFLFCIQEEDHECEVVVEIKQIEVHIVDAGQPNSNELIGDIFDLFQTDNLPVKLSAVNSRDATKNHHKGLSALLGLLDSVVEIQYPPVLEGFLVSAMLGH